MMGVEQFETILNVLGEKISIYESTIKIQKWEIADLKAKLEEAEAGSKKQVKVKVETR